MTESVTGQPNQQKAIRNTVVKLLWLLAGMVLFTVALIPLYQVFCDITGLNGKASGLLTPVSSSYQGVAQPLPGKARQVQFITQVGTGLPVEFTAEILQQSIKPGGRQQVMFTFRNRTAELQTARAVPSVSPAQASRHLLKIECFCFQELELKPYQTLKIPLIYLLSAAVPDEVEQLTLAYNLFPVTDDVVANGG